MASKISPKPKSISKPKAIKKPAVKAQKPVSRGTKPKAGGNNPVDKVKIRGEKNETSAADMSALTQGLAANFGATDVAAAGKDKPGAVDPGQASVDLARKFEGQKSQDLKGKLDNFQAAGGTTNNCADFVSSVLETSGRGVEQTASVSSLRKQLLDKGWTAIPADKAKPGDVWMTNSNTHGNRHTELVSQTDGKGGFHTIGSNNATSRQQYITEREKTGGVIYGYREPPLPQPKPTR